MEAVIGLPAGLFYGTGIPACVLVINRDAASQRKEVLFINADREYKEGKNQNQLRPEDIEWMVNVYRNRLEVEKYARLVPVAELETEDFNFNIRRYVDNSPPPEPHDVKAHLNGGIPIAEIEALQSYFSNYRGVKPKLFVDRDEAYQSFSEAITRKEDIKPLIESSQGVQSKHGRFHEALDGWWNDILKDIENLPKTKNVFALRRSFMESITQALEPQKILSTHKIRGALASYFDTLAADYKSVAATGWRPELIPEADILQSQFPEELEHVENDQARITELEGLFAAANESSDEEEEDDNDYESEQGILPKSVVKTLKTEKKQLAAEIRNARKQVKAMRKDADLLKQTGGSQDEINVLRTEASDLEAEAIDKQSRVDEIDQQLAQHTALEQELKALKANIRETEKKRDKLIASARAKITKAEAKQLILERFQTILKNRFDEYLRQYLRGFVANVENLHEKYAITLKQILKERDQEAEVLNQYLVELGYE